MPNYDAHVLSGIVTYPAVVALAGFLSTKGAPFKLSTMALILGYALYVLGADLPDMDHPNALIHRGTKPIVAVAVGSAVYIQALKWVSFSGWLNQVVAWIIGVIGAVAGWFGFTAIMPRHRGIVHSLLFAVIYGLLAYLLGTFGLGMSGGEGLYLFLAAFAGYTLHLLLDREISLL